MPHDLSNELDRELEELKLRQAKELEEFELRRRERLEKFETEERDQLEAFEKHESAELKEVEEQVKRGFEIKIDRNVFRVHEPTLTGSELRKLPNPEIGPDRDLFEVIPGGSDKKIEATDTVKMRDGLRFFTAPARINPGADYK